MERADAAAPLSSEPLARIHAMRRLQARCDTDHPDPALLGPGAGGVLSPRLKGKVSGARVRFSGEGMDGAADPGAGAETKTSDVDLCDTLFSMAYGGRTLLQVRFLSPTSS